MGLTFRIIRKISFFYNYWVKCKGDMVPYLRMLGVRIGNDCEIETHRTNFGSEPWLIQIGDKVSLARGVCLITHDGSSRLYRNRFAEMNSLGNKFGTIVIEDNCFIGINAIIMPGVVIGNNSIVGAGSIVTKSVAPYSVVAGNPAKYICSLDEHIERCANKLLKIDAPNRVSLRKELTAKLWGAER